ncbi:MAG: non-heme iron oxygenase ferredoxin subunit [Sulfuriflexus sp.]|nr:non-heme iron oxygenase ferredoxin subunit [Sulfuriflexus sp.]
MTDSYLFAAKLNQVGVGKMFRVQLEGKLLLLANVNGAIHACDEMCTHEDVSLALGALKDNCIKCSLHGSRFDLLTGKPLDDPAEENLRIYPVKVEGDSILVDIK